MYERDYTRNTSAGEWGSCDALNLCERRVILFLVLCGLAAVGVVCLKACRTLLHNVVDLCKRAVRRQENKTEDPATQFEAALERNTRSTSESDTKGEQKEQEEQQQQLQSHFAGETHQQPHQQQARSQCQNGDETRYGWYNELGEWQFSENIQQIDQLSRNLRLAMGIAGEKTSGTMEKDFDTLLDHARRLSAENVEGKQVMEELRREHAKSTKQHMEEINKWSALRQMHDELKKLYSKAKTDAALKLEAAERQHLKEKEAMQQRWDKDRAALKLKHEQQKQVGPDEAAWVAEKADLQFKLDEAEMEKQKLIKGWEEERATLAGVVGELRKEIEKLRRLQEQELRHEQNRKGEEVWKQEKRALEGEIKRLQQEAEWFRVEWESRCKKAEQRTEKDEEEAARNMELMKQLKEEAAEAKEAAARQGKEKDEFKSTLKSAIQRLQAERENANQIAAQHATEMGVLKETQEALEQGRRERAAFGNTVELLGLRLELLQCRKRSLLNERENMWMGVGQEMEMLREELSQAKAKVREEKSKRRHSDSLRIRRSK